MRPDEFDLRALLASRTSGDNPAAGVGAAQVGGGSQPKASEAFRRHPIGVDRASGADVDATHPSALLVKSRNGLPARRFAQCQSQCHTGFTGMDSEDPRSGRISFFKVPRVCLELPGVRQPGHARESPGYEQSHQ